MITLPVDIQLLVLDYVDALAKFSTATLIEAVDYATLRLEEPLFNVKGMVHGSKTWSLSPYCR